MKTVNALSVSEIDRVKQMLDKRYPSIYGDVFRVGINLSLRISDLLRIKYSDLDLKNNTLILKEMKTGKTKEIRLNNAALSVILKRRAEHPNDLWLFESNTNRSKYNPLTRHAVSRVFKEAGDRLGIVGVNTHSLRKTRGSVMYKAGVPLEMIAKTLNHSSTSETLRYIGITREQVLQTYLDYEL